MEMKRIADLLKENKYSDALELFLNTYWEYTKSLKLSTLRKVINLPDEELRSLLKIMDLALMEDMSSVLVRANYRRKKTVTAATWYCEELIDQGRVVEAEEILQGLLEEQLTKTEEEKIYYNLAVACIKMHRFQAGYDYMKKCEEWSSDSMHTRWGYYYLQKGDGEKAITFLQEGTHDKKDGVYAYGLMIQHYMLEGSWQQAEQILKQAKIKYPNFPRLMLEEVRYHYKTKDWQSMRLAIEALQDVSPFHNYQMMNALWEAESYYQERDILSLQKFLGMDEKIAKQTHFKNLPKTVTQNNIFLKSYKPVIQKNNYCVPASLEMILSMYGKSVSQEEVASHIFSVSGSSLSKAISFLEERDFYCRYFYSNVDLIKRLLHSEASIMMSLEYPTSSHVQVIAGYDDNFQCLLVQDPNLTDITYVEYEKFIQVYSNSQALAIAIIPSASSSALALLDVEEHEEAAIIQVLGENCHDEMTEESKVFLKQNIQNVNVAASYLKFLADAEDQELLQRAKDVLENSSLEAEYKYMVIALAFVRLKLWEQAETYLVKTKADSYQASFWYLNGRIYYEKNELEEAVNCFKKGVIHDPEDFVIWSYLALTLSFQGLYEQALHYSSIAMDINDMDIFIRMNHGMILYDNQFFNEARDQFDFVLRDKKGHGHAWYERARCDLELERYRHAERGFKTAISLDPEISVSYKELSQVYEFIYKDLEKVEPLLQKGLAETEDANLLLIELGDFYERQKEYEKARKCYLRTTEKYPEDPVGWVNLGVLLKVEGDAEASFKWLNSHFEKFQEESEYLINAGRCMWEASMEMEAEPGYFEQALAFLEKGIRVASANMEGALELYVNLIEETPYYERGIEFLQDLHVGDEENYLYPSYMGCLYEQNGFWNLAKKCYESGLANSIEVLPLYRLGELHEKMEEDKEARKYYKKVIELDPAHLQAHLNIAGICQRLNHKVQEVFYSKKAFALSPYSLDMEYFVSLLKGDELDQLQEDLEHLLNERNASFIYDSLAHVYSKKGELAKEEELVAQALELEPEETLFILHHLKILTRKKLYTKAKKIILPLISREVENRDIYEMFVEIYLEAGTVVQMEKDINRLKLPTKEKSLVCMFTAAAYDKVLLNRMENSEYDATESNWFTKMRKFGKASIDLGVLISLYENSLKLDRENVTAIMWLTDFYFQMEMKLDAIKSFEKFLKHQWDHYVAFHLASTYLEYAEDLPEKKRRQYSLQAQELLEQCLAVEESYSYILQYGNALESLGRLKEAEAAYLRGVELDPYNELAYYQLGVLYREQDLLMKAEENMIKAMEISPEDGQILNDTSIVYRLKGNYEAALEFVDKALEADPEEAFYLYNRACYLSLMGDYEECAAHLIDLFEMDEDNVFLEMAMEDEDLQSLKEAGLFPVEWSEK
jgi:tetratricopeptide (TPR) repeat protein